LIEKIEYNSIGGNETLNLKHIFDNLSQQLPEGNKNFKEFKSNNTVITELQENTFYDLTFDRIYIENAPKLKLIQTNTFSETNWITSLLWIRSYPIINSRPNHDEFDEKYTKFKN
jgi:hypothetical protein